MTDETRIRRNRHPDGYIMAPRHPDGMELLAANRCAFCLLYVIAMRARWSSVFNHHNLEPGEALIGDNETYGLTPRKYRTAKQFLQKIGFATFRTTNKGTVARLINTTVFDINAEQGDKQNANRPTSERQAGDKQATTNEEGKEGEKGKARAAKAAQIIRSLEIPPVLDTPEFKAAWSEWVVYRLDFKSIPKKPEKMFDHQLRFLAERPVEAIETLRRSMRNGWQGLFEPKGKSTQRHEQPI